MIRTTLCTIAMTGILALPVSACAEDITYSLNFKNVEAGAVPISDDEAHYIGVYLNEGNATFADEKATYRDDGFYDYVGARGTFVGYGTYSFEDGSKIVEKYAGSDTGEVPITVETNFIWGSGRFEGIHGQGTHSCVKSSETGVSTCESTASWEVP